MLEERLQDVLPRAVWEDQRGERRAGASLAPFEVEREMSEARAGAAGEIARGRRV